ncbi:MAG: hypothetical protein KDD82_11350, partial [Planctomycetes bacterium]|nr:hypothetical protein [Planctomycetota bacterium]
LQVEAGADLELPRFALPEAGGRLTLRGDPGASCALSLLSQPDREGELEPDESPLAAQPLAVGQTLSGRFDGPGDLDHLRLVLPADQAAAITVKAGTRSALRIEVLELLGGRARVAKRLRVDPGAERSLPPLGRAADAELVVRLAPEDPLRGLPATGDYRVVLGSAAPTPDREPNDRVEHACPIEVDRDQEAALGPADSLDWFRVAAPAGTVLRLTLSPQRAAELGLRVWEQGGGGLLPRQLYRSRGTTAAVAPRWRVPATGVVLISVEAAEQREPLAYRLRVERASPAGDGRETEPNDAIEFAEEPQRGVPVVGSLDGFERDWVRVPALGGGLMRVSLQGSGLDAVTLGLYAWYEGQPRLIGRFRAGERGVEVATVSVPETAQVAVLLVQGREGNSPYRLVLDAAARRVDAEVEPNDEPVQAQAFSSGTLSGTLSGPHDRDVIQIDAGRSLLVRATGDTPISVRPWGGDAPALVVPPGEQRPLPRSAASSTRDRVLIVIEAPPGHAGGDATYELSW